MWPNVQTRYGVDWEKVGTTFGLANVTSSREGEAPEQVYVTRTVDREDSRPVLIDGWVGYGSVGRLRLTRKQTSELIGLLAEAIR
jgi:hypothetical protein